MASGSYSRSPHRHGGNKCCSNLTNCGKALCARTAIYNSKMTWELYLYSLGYLDELNDYWRGQEEQWQKRKKKRRPEAARVSMEEEDSEPFMRID